MIKNQEEVIPNFLEGSESTLRELGENPLFTISLNKLEPVFKTWVYQVLKSIAPPPDESISYLSRKEVCKLLKISMPTLSKYYQMGIIKGMRVGSRILFTEEGIRDALKEIPNQRFRRS